MPTGQEIREAIFSSYAGLGFLGTTTALAGATNRLRDAVRFDMDTLSTEENSDAFVRITSTSNSDAGFVAKVKRIDPTTGDIYFDPVAGAAIVSGATYELLKHGIRFDDMDRATDRALRSKTSPWRLKPLSIIPQVEDWPVSAYSAGSGGDSNAAAVATDFAWQDGMFKAGMLVTNSGADGFVAPIAFRAVAGQEIRVFGRVGRIAQTASVRVFDITGGADIAIAGESEFTGGGGNQWFDVTATMPATLTGDVEIRLGGASASCVSMWSGVGVLPTQETVFTHENVLGEHDTALYYHYRLPTSATGGLQRAPIYGVNREPAGLGVMATFASPPGVAPVYYWERHRYAALSTAYMTAAQREVHDAASTDCNVDYIAAATVVELLQGRKLGDELQNVMRQAMIDLRTWDRRVGADPKPISESKTQHRVPLARL